MSVEKDIEAYMLMNYSKPITRNENGSFFAKVLEFPGCFAEGATEEEVISNLNEAMMGWIKIQMEDGEIIPEPTNKDFKVRIDDVVIKLSQEPRTTCSTLAPAEWTWSSPAPSPYFPKIQEGLLGV